MPNYASLFGYNTQDHLRDEAALPPAYRNGGGGDFRQTLLGRSYNGRNPDPFTRFDGTPKGYDAETAYDIRRDAKRIVKPGAAALAAQNQLYDPTLALTRRGAADYGQLYRDESGKTLDWATQQMSRFNPEATSLLHLLLSGAAELNAPGYANAYDDRNVQQNIRGAQSARGLAYSPGSALEELIGLDRNSEGRRIQRGQYGAGIAQLGQNYYQSSLAQLLGVGPQGSSIMSPVQGTPTQDFLSLDVNDMMSRRNEKAARRAGQMGLIGSGLSALGEIIPG